MENGKAGSPDAWRKFLKEPLLHFVALGAVLFAVHAWLRPDVDDPAAARVHISEHDVRWLADTWTRQWHRAPTHDELRGLVSAFLREEVLAREARALGLDDDPVVRRRLVQKLQFLVEDTLPVGEPDDDELRRVYLSTPERYTAPARVSFVHLCFSRERQNATAGAQAALAELAAGAPTTAVAERADPLLVDPAFVDAPEPVVAAQLGAEFARAVFALEPGAWHGPIGSPYGLHLVRVSAHEPARLQTFEEVRAVVRDAWRAQQQQAAEAAYFDALLRKYDVLVDRPVQSLVGPIDPSLPLPPASRNTEDAG